MSRIFAVAGAMVLVAGVLLRPAPAAALSCASLPSPTYVAGTAAAGRVLAAIAPVMASKGGATLVYQELPGCAAIEAVARDTDPMTCALSACLHGSAAFYTLDGTRKSCDLDPAGTHAHVALAEVASHSCPAFGGGDAKGVVDQTGPVIPIAFAAAAEHPEKAILAEEAHFVFGFVQAGVAPWTSGAAVINFDDRDGGQVLLGQRIQVPPGRFKGVVASSSDDMIARLIGGDAAHGIGLLSTAALDPRRLDVKALAFQALGQRGAYYPDAHAASYEKQNVRDGHYPLWGYLHVVALADPMDPTKVASAQAQNVAALLLGPATADLDPVAAQAQSGLVPRCAMKVSKDDDGGPMKPWQAPEPCGCYFDKSVKMGSTSCTACTDDTVCGTGHCRRGYCEVR